MGKNRNHNRNMANYNQPDPDLNKPDELPEDVEDPTLNIKPDENIFIPNSLVYNAYGVAPTQATYRILMSDLKEMFEKVCKDQISGVDRVTAAFDPDTGEMQFYCMFEEGCKHFNDQSMANTMLADQKPRYFSNEVKTFAKKFGMVPSQDCPRDKDGKIIGEFAKFGKKNNDKLNADLLFVKTVDRSNNITRGYSMRLSWTTLIRLIFDQDGQAFTKQYGKRPTRCDLSAQFIFTKDSGHTFGKVLYLEVVKTVKGLSSNNQRPKTAFNYREA